jgi:hypothetical protein
MCRFLPCNEILIRLYKIFKKGKKQDLTPFLKKICFALSQYPLKFHEDDAIIFITTPKFLIQLKS